MYPPSFATAHPATPMLKQWAVKGSPVNTGRPWTRAHIEASLRRGPHVLAKFREDIEALLQETKDKVQDGYAKIVKWGEIKSNFPKSLKISPVAMVPHKSRKFRTILNLSFKLRHKGTLLP